MKTSYLLVPALLLCLPLVVNAQKNDAEADYGIFQTQAEYHQFMGDVKKSVAQNPGMKKMIPFINDVVLGKQIGWSNQKYGGQGSSLGMLANSKIRADLEMDNDQYKELQKLNEEVRRRAAEQMRGIDFSDTKNLVEHIRKIREDSQEAMGAVLLPHQQRRLSQIRTQSKLRYRSLAQLLTSDPFREELEITEQQSDELLDAEKEIEAELAKDIAKLRAEAREKLLKKLNRRQQKQVDEILGDAFDFEQNSKNRNPKREIRK